LVGDRKHIVSATFETYIKNSNASPRVKDMLIKAREELLAQGIDENSYLTKEQLHKWTSRKSFVKADENVLYRSPYHSKQKSCRLIQGAQPEFIVLVAPWIMSLQTYIKKKWNINNYIVFTSGVTNDEAGNCITNGLDAWLILEDDIGTFDASICLELCNLELWICKYYHAPKAVRSLVKANMYTHGGAYGGFKYKVKGTRKSGDPFTSLFNSMLNAFFHVYIYSREKNISVKKTKLQLKMLVQGDDNFMRHLGPKVDFVGGMLRLGFKSEAIYRTELYQAEFCSSRLYKTDVGWVFGPKPGRVLSKFGLFINPPKELSKNVLLRGAALGLYKQCYFIPPIKSYLDMVLRRTSGTIIPETVKPHLRHYLNNVTGNMPWRMSGPNELIKETPEIMLSLHEQYGWDYTCQNLFDKFINTISFGTILSHPLLQLLADRDTDGTRFLF